MVRNNGNDGRPLGGHDDLHIPNTDDNLILGDEQDTLHHIIYIQPMQPPRYLYIIACLDTEVKQKM